MAKLKPSDLGVTGKQRTIQDHLKIVKSSLMKLSNKKVTTACLDILTAKSGDKIIIGGVNASDINEIKNYFAEVAGPILIMNGKYLPNVTERSQVFYSTSDTERLYDFKLYVGSKEYLISNKQLKGGTNTLKPGDVLSLVDKDKDLTKKWKNTKYYKVFKILHESNVVSGPMRAVAEVYPNMVQISKKDYDFVLSKLTKNDTRIPQLEVPSSFLRVIKSDPVAYDHFKKKRGADASMLNFVFEKLMVNESRRDDKYNDLFVDVTSGNVEFLKFDLSSTGVVKYELVNPRNAHKKAIFRSKQGVERRSSSSGALKLDKLGFQP